MNSFLFFCSNWESKDGWVSSLGLVVDLWGRGWRAFCRNFRWELVRGVLFMFSFLLGILVRVVNFIVIGFRRRFMFFRWEVLSVFFCEREVV